MLKKILLSPSFTARGRLQPIFAHHPCRRGLLACRSRDKGFTCPCVSGSFLVRAAVHQDVEPGCGQGQPFFSSGASHSASGGASTDASTGPASSAAAGAGSSEGPLFISGSAVPRQRPSFL